MSCFAPLLAYRPLPGSGKRSLFFPPDQKPLVTDRDLYGGKLSIPCGQCIDCRIERSRQWAIRCMHEASLYDENCFITLTYSDEKLPTMGSLVPDHFDVFMANFRERVRYKWGKKLRFYACGEYGDKSGRPHYHALIFGFDFNDKTFWRTSPSGHRLYRSELLESLWSFGSSEIGDVTFDSAAYVARYCVKKVTGKRAAEHYYREDDNGVRHWLVPEFPRMSLRPGIGDPWLKKYHTDVYNQDFVLVNGVKVKPPKFYDKKYNFMLESEFETISLVRAKKNWHSFRALAADNTAERRAVKAEVAEARYSQLKRGL